MNCFEWQNRSSDYLDGSLIGPLKKDADDHLDTCKSCNERHKHYRQILSSIAARPRSTLPIPIRKSPLATVLPRLDFQSRRSRWDRTPWFIRTSVEGLGIAFIILFVVAMVPRVRTFYERSIERRLDAFNMADVSLDSAGGKEGEANAPLVRGKLAAGTPAAGGDEYSGENENEADSDADAEEGAGALLDDADGGTPVRVGSSEIWRFNLKTDSPHEVRPKVVQMLTDLNVSPDTAGIGGIEAPGGIQFDLLVPQSVIPGIKRALQKIAAAQPGHAAQAVRSADAIGGEAFTWYKNKSKRKIPPGKARVVIWLSQM